MHFVRTCIVSILKKIVQVIEDEIYSKLFEIYKVTEKVVLV